MKTPKTPEFSFLFAEPAKNYEEPEGGFFHFDPYLGIVDEDEDEDEDEDDEDNDEKDYEKEQTH